MSLSTLLLLIIIGLAAGIIGGLVGVGGAVIIIPALVFILGMNQYQAQGTSLAVLLPPIGLFAVINYYKAGQVNLKYAIIIGLAFIIGAYLGSSVALNLPVNILKRIFGGVLALVATYMILGK